MTKSSSKVAPGKNGNTNHSSPTTKKKQPAERRHWCLTVPWENGNKKPFHLIEWMGRHCEAYVVQTEQAPDTGYVHLQCAMSLIKKKRLSWLKVHFHPTAHAEPTRNVDKAAVYCMKEDTRINGPWIFPAPPNQIEDPMDGLSFYEWQKDIIDLIRTKPDQRSIYWYWEPIGSRGKSVFTKHLCIHYEVAFMQSAKKADIAYAYNNQPIVIFNIPREKEDVMSYDALESLKDGLMFSAKYESTAKIFNCPHVIVFANFPPDESKLSTDRWKIVRL